MNRTTKTAEELRAMLMDEARKLSQCDDVTDVAIISPTQQNPGVCNWDAAWSTQGGKLAPREADEIARQLRARFDLAASR